MLTLLLAGVLAPSPALACGGFFCTPSITPVEQVAEQIVFGVDETAGTVTAHVQIAFEGAADDFAWVVPVPAEPELFLSNDALFLQLTAATAPSFTLQGDTLGICRVRLATMDSAMSVDDGMSNGVEVVAEETVGPYDTVLLRADDATLLVDWLQDAGYDLPSELDPVLQPYVAGDQYFLALKLSAGKDTGDLAPLGMRYPGTAASIPIQLTAVAAAPDMGLEVFVLGASRAVPDNYLHVTLNDAAIDWFSAGSNYYEVVSRAADEAGGQAFVTEFSGPTGDLWDRLDTCRDDLSFYEQQLTAWAWAFAVAPCVPWSSQLLAVLQRHAPVPDVLVAQGVEPQDFYSCMSCYDAGVENPDFDAVAATADLDEAVLQPLAEADRLIEAHPWVTRLNSTLDAAEMTVDPIFVFNEDLPQDVSNARTATRELHCGVGEGTDGGEQVLVLPDGREIPLPSSNWLERNETTEFEHMAELTSPAAILIEDYGAEGTGEILFDYREQAAIEARRFGRGCAGCDGGATPVGWLGFAAVLIGLRRRR